MARLLTVGVMAILVCGCVHQRQVPFNETEYAPYKSPGSATISGQAFMKTVGGDVKYGAGNKVYLHPATKYAMEWHDVSLVQGLPLSDADSRIMKYTKETQADGEGRFRFTGVAAGDYIVSCYIVWGIPGTWRAIDYTGGTAFTRVSVKNGESVSIVVTR